MTLRRKFLRLGVLVEISFSFSMLISILYFVTYVVYNCILCHTAIVPWDMYLSAGCGLKEVLNGSIERVTFQYAELEC